MKGMLTIEIETNVLCHEVESILLIGANHVSTTLHQGCEVIFFNVYFLIREEDHLTSFELKRRSATFLDGIFMALGPYQTWI